MKKILFTIFLTISMNALADLDGDKCIDSNVNVCNQICKTSNISFIEASTLNSPSIILANSDIGQCMGDCASEQGICIGQCQGDGQCISNCAAAHGRCVARCH